VVNIQGDEPLISPQMIESATFPLLEDSNLQMSTLCRRITDPQEVFDRCGEGVKDRKDLPCISLDLPSLFTAISGKGLACLQNIKVCIFVISTLASMRIGRISS